MSRLEKLIQQKISRRNILKKAGKASAFIAIGSVFPEEFWELKFFKEKALLNPGECNF